MNNRIININSNEHQIIRKQIESDTFLVELDGNNIQNERQLFDVMEKAYNLHTLNVTWGKNWTAFDDLMTDLDWIGYH